jgi:hypothetical protein
LISGNRGVLKLIAPNGLVPPSHSLVQQSRSPVASLSSSPFLTGHSLAGSLNSAFPMPSNSADIPLKHEDYPNVKYWYKHDWFNHIKDNGNATDVGMANRGKTLISKGINKTMKYIENEEVFTLPH